jgi:hypothetical protein
VRVQHKTCFQTTVSDRKIPRSAVVLQAPKKRLHLRGRFRVVGQETAGVVLEQAGCAVVPEDGSRCIGGGVGGGVAVGRFAVWL